MAIEVVRAVRAWRCFSGRGLASSPLRAQRIAEALESDARLRGLPGPGGAVQARQEHRERTAGGGTRSIWTALTEPAELALLADLDALGTRVRELARRHDYREALAEIASTARTGRSVLHGRLRYGGRRASQDGAPDAHGRTTRLVLTLADISEIVPQTE